MWQRMLEKFRNNPHDGDDDNEDGDDDDEDSDDDDGVLHTIT